MVDGQTGRRQSGDTAPAEASLAKTSTMIFNLKKETKMADKRAALIAAQNDLFRRTLLADMGCTVITDGKASPLSFER